MADTKLATANPVIPSKAQRSRRIPRSQLEVLVLPVSASTLLGSPRDPSTAPSAPLGMTAALAKRPYLSAPFRFLRPGVAQADGAIEDELARTRIGIEREVAEPLELITQLRPRFA